MGKEYERCANSLKRSRITTHQKALVQRNKRGYAQAGRKAGHSEKKKSFSSESGNSALRNGVTNDTVSKKWVRQIFTGAGRGGGKPQFSTKKQKKGERVITHTQVKPEPRSTGAGGGGAVRESVKKRAKEAVQPRHTSGAAVSASGQKGNPSGRW